MEKTLLNIEMFFARFMLFGNPKWFSNGIAVKECKTPMNGWIERGVL